MNEDLKRSVRRLFKQLRIAENSFRILYYSVTLDAYLDCLEEAQLINHDSWLKLKEIVSLTKENTYKKLNEKEGVVC